MKKRQPAVCRGYILGLAGVTLLILLGGGHNVFALSLSLLLPGVALLCRPPKQSPGVWIDRMALAFMAILLFSFIPLFYWPEPYWRTAAAEIFQIDLPPILSVQPWVSFEAWVCALAGLAWFYAASAWEINYEGRKRFYLTVSIVIGVLAFVVLWGNMIGAKYPAAENSRVFSFFPNRNQTANFLALGGVVTFGYAMSALRSGRLLPIVGFIVSGCSFLALVWGTSRAGVLLYFLGIILIYFLHLFTGRVFKVIKLGFPLLLIGFSVFLVSNSRTNERILDFIASSENWSQDYRMLMAQDTWAMIEDAPLTGHGLGTFASVFPQYRDRSANYQRAVHPESDLLWLASESGLLALALLLGLITAYLLRCRGLSSGRGGSYRLVALTALIVFVLHSLVDVSGHRPGTIYFAILFAVFALPKEKAPRSSYKPRAWRFLGGFLVLIGLLWGLSGLTGLTLHSSAALSHYEAEIEKNISAEDYGEALLEVDKWIDIRPMDWRAYFRRATLTLSEFGSLSEAAADFRRARFVEPNIGVIALEEGLVWIPYEPKRTIAAWREVFFREVESRERVFQLMLNKANRNRELMAGLARLSELDPYYRVIFLEFQSGDDLMEELNRDLETDARLAQFSRSQRTSILKNWVLRGNLESAEEFLKDNESNLNRPWWLWSLLRKGQGEFEDAVRYIRSAVKPPVLPEVSEKDISLERLKREFAVAPGDLIAGTALLQYYINEENYQKVREVTRTMTAAQGDVPQYVTYWFAESFFQLQDYDRSWNAFEVYLKQLWEE